MVVNNGIPTPNDSTTQLVNAARFLPSNSTEPGLGSTLHGRLCWSRGTLPCAGGSFGQEIVQECTKGYGTTQGGGGRLNLHEASEISDFAQGCLWYEKRMWKRGGVTWFLRSAIRDAAKAKGHTGRWRRWRGRWGRGNLSKTRLTVKNLKRLLSLLLCTLLGSNIFSFPPGTFESMIFLFPRRDMDAFPEVSLSESNSSCVSGWRCWELWHGDCGFGKMKTTWAITKTRVV